MKLVNDQITDSVTIGRKFDSGKPMYSLLPPKALGSVVDVLTFGAQKYEVDNWKYVDNAHRRYFDAAQRHLWAWQQGEKLDNESGLHHLSHALCCLMFLYEHDNFEEQVNVNEIREIAKEGLSYIDKILDKNK